MNSPFIQSVIVFFDTRGTETIVAFAALVFGILIIRNIMKVIKMAIIDSKLEKSMVKLVLTIVQFLLYFLLATYILSEIGVGITGVIAAFSAFTLAIGLAIQDVMSGMANGLVIVTTRPFRVGDTVEIGGIYGDVKETNLMHTVIDTPDKTHIFLPNKTVYNSVIKNYSTNPTRKVDYEVGVDFGADPDVVRDTFEKLLQTDPYAIKDPKPVVNLKEIGANEVVYKLSFYVKNKDYWNALNDIKQRAYEQCNKNGIGFAFPQVTLSQREPIIIKQEMSGLGASSDDTKYFFPNNEVCKQLKPAVKIEYEIGVDFETNPGKVENIFNKLLRNSTYVLTNPTPSVILKEVGPNQAIYKLVFYVIEKEYWTAYNDIRQKISDACNKNSIGFSFPEIMPLQKELVVNNPEVTK